VSEGALDANLAAHEFDQLFGDGEAESGSAVFAGGRAVDLGEGLEEVGQGFLWDSEAGVAHGEQEGDVVGGVVGAGHLDDDLALIGELEGVDDEVGQDLAKTARVPAESVGHISFNEGYQFDVFGLGAVGEDFDGGIERVAQVKIEVFEVEFTGFEFGEVEDIVDDGEQGFRAGLDGIHVALLFAIQGGVLEEGGHADDPVERRADFMADVGKKLGFKAEGFEGMVPGGGEIAEDLVAFGDIHHGADHTDRVIELVTDEVSAVQDFSVGAVGAGEAIFGGPDLFISLDQLAQAGQDARSVIGVDVLVPPGGVGEGGRGRVAEGGMDAFAPPDLIGEEVPIPDGVVGGSGDEVEAFLLMMPGGAAGLPAAERDGDGGEEEGGQETIEEDKGWGEPGIGVGWGCGPGVCRHLGEDNSEDGQTVLKRGVHGPFHDSRREGGVGRGFRPALANHGGGV
jgi:hypothetical protein